MGLCPISILRWFKGGVIGEPWVPLKIENFFCIFTKDINYKIYSLANQTFVKPNFRSKMNTEQITVVDNTVVDNNQIVDNTEACSPKKKPVLKTIPKKIMGYLKFAHFVLNSNDDSIVTKLFLDKSIEEIVTIVNDVVENGNQDKTINDLRKQLINSAKPKKTRAKKVKKTDHADAIVTDLVTLARTADTDTANTESPTVEKQKQKEKEKKVRVKKTKTPTPVITADNIADLPTHNTPDLPTHNTPVITAVITADNTADNTPVITADNIADNTADNTPVITADLPTHNTPVITADNIANTNTHIIAQQPVKKSRTKKIEEHKSMPTQATPTPTQYKKPKAKKADTPTHTL